MNGEPLVVGMFLQIPNGCAQWGHHEAKMRSSAALLPETVVKSWKQQGKTEVVYCLQDGSLHRLCMIRGSGSEDLDCKVF